MQVLQDCAATFHFLIGNDEDETQDSVKTDTDTGGLSEQVKATALKRVKELLGQIVSSQIVPAYDELRYESTESKSDACLHLHHALQRLSFLTSHTDLHAMDAALSDVDSPFSTWYELANGVVDVGLLTLTAAKNEDFEALSKDTSRMIASALEFMFFLSFWGLSAAYVTRKMDGSEHSQETVTLDQTNRLIDICEAIVTGEDSDEIAFHLGLKLFAIKKLTALYIMMNSDVSTFTKSPRTPPEMVQAKISLVIERALIAVCLLDVQAESFDDFKEDAKMCPLFVQSAASMRKEILTIASQLGQLLIAGILVPSKGVLMLKYYGLSDTPAQKNVTSSIQVTPTTCAFGEKWNIISSAAAKETLTSNLVKRLELLDFKDRNFPDRLEELLESTSGFVFQSIGQALELYFSGLVPSLDPVLDLTKMLMPFIKTWPTLLKSNKSVLCSALKNVLVTLLADACQNLVDRMVTFDRSEAKTNRRYSVISDLSMYSENGTAPVTCKLATWSEVNAVWKIWGAMGGLIHHILGALEDENAPDQSLFEDL